MMSQSIVFFQKACIIVKEVPQSGEEGMAGAGKGGMLPSPASTADSQKTRLRLLFMQSTELDN